MAMLAEKRTKTRYYLHHKALNPRGNAWCEDSSKFGQRMLEKMGWAEGKGLGVKEDGSTDPVTVSYKWDSKGMGYKGADGDEAVAQQKDFDALLATLSQNSSPDVKSTTTLEKTPKSLELMSQKSRARVHYHKFTRGKDLSRASSKDLASILGMATEIESPVPASPGPIVTPDVGPPIEQNMVTTFGITTIARGNINEYFKQKFDERKRKLASLENEDCAKKVKISDDSETLISTTEKDEPLDDNPQPDEVSKKKKKKKKKNRHEEEDEVQCNTSFALNDTTQDESDQSTSKGRRKSVTWGDVEVSFVSKYIKDMVDTSSDSVSGESDALNTVEAIEETSSTVSKKKKKKDKKKNKEAQSNEDNDGIVEEPNISGKKKKRKNKPSSECTTDDSFDITGSEKKNDLESLVNTCAEDLSTKKKRKKTLVEQEENSYVDSSESADVIVTESSAKKKKTKKLKILPDVQICSERNDESLCDDSEVTSKKKKHKSKQSNCSEDTASDKIVDGRKKKKKGEGDEVILNSSVDENPQPEEYLETKKKKKKRKKEILESDSCQETAFCHQVDDNISSEVTTDTNSHDKVKKKKKKKNLTADSEIALDDSSEAGNESVSDSNERLALSAQTQERMAKWKDRRKAKNEKNSSDEMVPEKPTTAKLEYNPNQPTQDYNHRKVLSTLGYNVKGATDKTITVKMPESNFSGSNLDVIPGYGQTIKTC